MTELDNVGYLRKYDRSGMIDVLDSYPKQCKEAIELGHGFQPDLPPRPERVIVCGMGGSAMAGEIARRFSRVPVVVNRNYTLPAFLNSRTLLVAVSYSGNTAETLSGLDKGINAGIPAFAISSGGKLKKIAQVRKIPFLQIPGGYQPRAAMGYLALPLLTVLDRAGLLLGKPDWEELLEALTGVQEKCTAASPTQENPAKKLSQRLYRKIPLIYGTAGNTDLVAMRFKTQINENAKQPVFWNVLPEINHNEILSFVDQELRENLSCIFLENDYDLAENRARIEIMRELLTERAVSNDTIKAEGKSELSQVIAQIYFGDYVSYYLAILNKIDPTPVELIESFKQKLAQR